MCYWIAVSRKKIIYTRSHWKLMSISNHQWPVSSLTPLNTSYLVTGRGNQHAYPIRVVRDCFHTRNWMKFSSRHFISVLSLLLWPTNQAREPQDFAERISARIVKRPFNVIDFSELTYMSCINEKMNGMSFYLKFVACYQGLCPRKSSRIALDR